jgi:hypothetical protein
MVSVFECLMFMSLMGPQQQCEQEKYVGDKSTEGAGGRP